MCVLKNVISISLSAPKPPDVPKLSAASVHREHDLHRNRQMSPPGAAGNTSLSYIDMLWTQALAREEHELAEADSRFLLVDGLRVHYKAAPAPDNCTGPGATQRLFTVLVLHAVTWSRGAVITRSCRTVCWRLHACLCYRSAVMPCSAV